MLRGSRWHVLRLCLTFILLVGFNASAIQPARAAGVDLELSALNVTPLEISTYQGDFQVDYTVTNIGDDDIPTLSQPWLDRIYLSDNPSSPSINGNQFGLIVDSITRTNALAAGASYSQSLTVQMPSEVAPGTYYLIVSSDDDFFFADSNRSNNRRAFSETLSYSPTALPNLTGAFLSLSPTGAITSAETVLDVSLVISNTGAATFSGEFTTNFFLTPEQTLDNAIVFASLNSGALTIGPNSSTVITANLDLFDYFDGGFGLPPRGTFYVAAQLDQSPSPFGAGNVYEADEFDNLLFSPEQVIIAEPDFAISATLLDPTDTFTITTFNQPLSIVYTVTNQGGPITAGDQSFGSTPEHAISARFFSLGVFQTITQALAIQPNEVFDGGGATKSYSITVSPALIGQGPFDLLAVADWQQRFAEGDETNNVAELGSFFYDPILPDLRIDGIVGPTGLITTLGGPITLSYTVTNIGGAFGRSDWFDRVVLRNGTTGSFVTTIAQLDRFNAAIPESLAQGESYTVTAMIDLPREVISGTYALQLEIGNANSLYGLADQDQTNNITRTSEFVYQPLLPDLIVRDVEILTNGPITDYFSPAVQVAYTVVNQGEAIFNDDYFDQFSIATTSTIDFNTAVFFLPAIPRSTNLGIGEARRFTETVLISPQPPSDTYYLFVSADQGSSPLNEQDEFNNSGVSRTAFVFNPSSSPAVEINVTDGSPGSSFILAFNNLTREGRFDLVINGIIVRTGLAPNANGSLVLTIVTANNAAEGFYKVELRPINGLTQATNSIRYQLRNDAPLRPAPPDEPDLIGVPATIVPEFIIWAPLVIRAQ